jgi:flagellin
MSVINTNVKALVAQESMRSNNSKLSTAMERLSTGLRINSAKDDAAGLAISNRMTAQIRGMSMAIKNANDGISMAQTADGAYGQVTSMLQRMRELAVQAANGAVSGSDRESIQLEIEELKAEINNVAERTNFNGIKLLDGSAQDIKLQTGTNEGELMSVGFSSVKAKDIGSGDNPALTSVGGTLATTGVTAFSAGDVVINGVVVGASLATDDAVSYESATDERAASAIAKVAAINRVTEFSGVYAQVNDTTVLGQTMATASTSDTGSVTINNVTTATFNLTADKEINRQLVAQAINNITSQTGVRAVNTGDDQQGVTLVADDGRNVTIALNTFTDATKLGLAAAETYVGTFSLYSQTGDAITIDHRIENTDTFKNTGLSVGTFGANEATAVTYKRDSAAANTAPAFGTTGALTGGTVVINGIAIGAAVGTDDTASFQGASGTQTGLKAASAIAIAAAINKLSDKHGVTATAQATVLRGEAFTGVGTDEGDIFINGVVIEKVAATSRDAVMDRINEVSGRTGVTAVAYGEAIELRAADGRNISIGTDSTLDASKIGLSGVTLGVLATTAGAVTHFAAVALSSDKAFTVEQGSEGTNSSNFEKLGFRVGTFGGKDTGMKVDEVDVTTQLGAGMAITAIDHAINDVASAQARSGAFQNRLDASISVLSESSENASAARSRILDTDYATETTALAKAQIVQQAATAMLAQANQQQQSVLALLQ